jgi:hypothetical protein
MLDGGTQHLLGRHVVGPLDLVHGLHSRLPRDRIAALVNRVGYSLSTRLKYRLGLHPAPQHVRQADLRGVHTGQGEEGLVKDIPGGADEWLWLTGLSYWMARSLVAHDSSALFFVLTGVLSKD